MSACLMLLIVWSLLSGLTASAQTVSGTLLGMVQDQQGGVVSKAAISARNLETGATRTASTDDNGEYRIPSIPAGPYELIASAPGFKTQVREGVIVTVGADVKVDAVLSLGAVGEKI